MGQRETPRGDLPPVGPFAPLAGLHTGDTGNAAANRTIGRACVAITIAFAVMVATQFLRSWLAGLL